MFTGDIRVPTIVGIAFYLFMLLAIVGTASLVHAVCVNGARASQQQEVQTTQRQHVSVP